MAAVALAGGLIVLERDDTRTDRPEPQGNTGSAPSSEPPQPDEEPEPAETVLFEDQFDGLNPDAWLVADYAVDVNDEKQYYTPDNVTTRDGMLVITAEDREVGGQDYASGLLSTAGKFSFTYGKVEWRAKMASGKGVWPSLWMHGDDCAEVFQSGSQNCDTWPLPGSDEIDVVEIRGSEPHRVNMTQHYNPDEPSDDIPNECDWDGPDMSADFHTYGLEWTPDALVWTVDGVERCRSEPGTPIPDAPMFLIMNMAIGGHYDGDPDDSTQFPVEYQIDWVRVTETN